MDNSFIRFKDPDFDIKEQWKLFARIIYKNLLLIEVKTKKEFIDSRKFGKSFIERKKLMDVLEKCSKLKTKIEQSVKDRKFYMSEIDYDIINDKGFEFWFRNFDNFLMESYPQVAIDNVPNK
jgi:hypothetical protein